MCFSVLNPVVGSNPTEMKCGPTAIDGALDFDCFWIRKQRAYAAKQFLFRYCMGERSVGIEIILKT